MGCRPNADIQLLIDHLQVYAAMPISLDDQKRSTHAIDNLAELLAMREDESAARAPLTVGVAKNFAHLLETIEPNLSGYFKKLTRVMRLSLIAEFAGKSDDSLLSDLGKLTLGAWCSDIFKPCISAHDGDNKSSSSDGLAEAKGAAPGAGAAAGESVRLETQVSAHQIMSVFIANSNFGSMVEVARFYSGDTVQNLLRHFKGFLASSPDEKLKARAEGVYEYLKERPQAVARAVGPEFLREIGDGLKQFKESSVIDPEFRIGTAYLAAQFEKSLEKKDATGCVRCVKIWFDQLIKNLDSAMISTPSTPLKPGVVTGDSAAAVTTPAGAGAGAGAVHGPGCSAAGCSKEGKLRCSRCHTQRYCSRACQEKDWPRHKAEHKDKEEPKG
jgi:hypothetical protein